MSDAIARLERELADARREADSAARTRSAFLAAMSHELKTPMNAVFGCARLLLETTLTAQQHEHVATTIAAGETMLTIIEDAIDYAALEGGALALAHAPFDLAAVIDAAVQIDAGRAHEKGLDLAAVIDPALPALVVGDAARVRLIVRKLLSNAITFTDTGSVLVRAAVAAGGGVRIEFEDTGVGVRAETAPDLFEAFVQGDISTTRGTAAGPRAGHRPPPGRGDGRHHRRRRPGRRRLAVLGRAAARRPAMLLRAGPAPVPAFAGRRAVVLCAARATCLAVEGELRAAGFEVAVARHGGRRPRLPHRQRRHRPARPRPARARFSTRWPCAWPAPPLSTVPQAVLVLAPTTERQALPAVFAPGATWLPRPAAAPAAARDARPVVPGRRRAGALRPDGGPRLAAHPGRRRLPRQPAHRRRGCSRSAATPSKR